MGRELDPQARAFLDVLKQVGVPDFAETSVEETRPMDVALAPEHPFPAAVRDAYAAVEWAADLAYQRLVYPATAFDRAFPSHEGNGEGYFLTTDAMEWFTGRYLEHEGRLQPGGVPAGRPRPPGLPPATVVTAGFDPLRDEGVAYVERLADAGVPTTHRHYDGVIHGFVSVLTEPA